MNWKNEAIEKLKKYDAMRQALRNIPEEITRLKEDICSYRGIRMDGISVKNSVSRRDDAMINNLAHQQELEWTLKQVKQWLAVADRGLLALPHDERMILQRLYLYPEHNSIARLCSELGVEQSTIYRKRDQALYRFTVALYGFAET
ncbi:MAG: hypothetical protein IKK11_06425 [Oscillospiraceae bacterium]|nr:hypothetical protein [Oscillospiraceae bacterium]